MPSAPIANAAIAVQESEASPAHRRRVGSTNAPQSRHGPHDNKRASMGNHQGQYLKGNETQHVPNSIQDDDFISGDSHDGSAHGTGNRRVPSKDKSRGSQYRNWWETLTSRGTHHDQIYDEIERYRRERDKWRDNYDCLDKWNRKNETTIQKLREDLHKEKDRADRAERSAHYLEAAMDNKEVFLGIQAQNDDEIHQKFGSIFTSIKTWSNNFNAGSGHAFREDMMPEYQRVAPLCTNLQILEQIVAEKRQKRLFVRGWAAYVMTRSLFRTLDPQGNLGEDVWMDGTNSEIFSRLENTLWFADRKAVTHRAFNDWRAFTVDLLSKALPGKQSAGENVTQAVQNAVQDVMDLVSHWCVTDDHDALLVYEDRLRKIFIEAVQLAQFLRQQRALWSARFPCRPLLPGQQETGPLMYDPSRMKVEKGDDDDMNPEQLKQQYVDIVVTPALYKRGNPNGERFEIEEASCKAAVVMRLA